ncbi:MAG: DNA-processing protein DprA [Planctomycetota bacterium]|nr:DNA-processing protein DprA [Planctomycetota bacterium]MDA1210948.1 DNA-processing protein DprA [Planctomycetota bacterium]
MTSAELSPDELLDLIQLTLVPGVGTRTIHLLLNHFTTAKNVLAAPLRDLQEIPHIGVKAATAIRQVELRLAAEQTIARCQSAGIMLVPFGSPAYPPMLAEIPDPPILLYCQGELLPQDQLSLAIVGSRSCTTYGMRQAEKLAAGLTHAGFTIVSGLARGIDAAAHRGALIAGGRTVAVSATGLSNIYPPEHRELAAEVSQNGSFLSEAALDQSPIPGIFPLRNRIISGLSLGVIIVEAARKSGAMHTVRHAQEQGREVFAVPGRLDSAASEGCHDLIRDGVALIRGVDDVLEALGPLIKPVAKTESKTVLTPRELLLNEQEQQVLNAVHNEPCPIDEVMRSCELESSRVLSTLTVLEMKRLVRRLPGGQIVRVTN